jgi:uncharacterized protein involved in response to NO
MAAGRPPSPSPAGPAQPAGAPVAGSRQGSGAGPGRRAIPIAVAAPAPSAGTSPRWLLAAPHRLYFFFGMLGLGACSLWWLAQLAARGLGAPLAPVLPASWLHGWSMANGFLPFFMFGFLFTAGPRWLNVEGPAARTLLAPGLLALAGLLLALSGAHWHGTAVAAGAMLMAAGWAALLWRFARLVRRSRCADRVHARLVLIFFTLGTLAHLAFATGVVRLSAAWIHGAEQMALWLFLAPMYVTVAHRLIPFFTSSVLPALDAWRPLWLLVALNGLVVAHGLLSPAWPWVAAPAYDGLRLAVAAAAAALLWFVAWRWGVVQSLRNRLLAMLHLGFLWLGIALALYAWNTAAQLVDLPQAGLGLAPLHALTMGFFGGVAYAMVTRVTAGHGGRSLSADDLVWTLFWMLQAAVLVRLLAAAWPAQAHWFGVLAMTLWCVALLPWALRNALIYLRPRVDGQPG